jgi:FlaA1/EpsC-like NDP-sugar epimerase
MNYFYFKYTPIIFLIILDYFSVILSIYLSAAFIVSDFVPFLDLFFYHSIFFFTVAFIINYKLNNYTYLNRSFGLENIKNLLFSLTLILIFIYTFKILLELIEIRLYFFDYYLFSARNIINQVILFSFFSFVIRFLVSKLSSQFYKKNDQVQKTNSDYVIYGAGRSGFLFLDINENKPKFIIDDDPYKIGRFVRNIKIISFGEFEHLLKINSQIKKIIFCIPSIESIKFDEIKKKILKLGISFENQSNTSGDNIEDIIKNISDNSQNIKDEINQNIQEYFDNKIILVTGAGGSIGKELCYKISKFKIKKLIAIDIDEFRLSRINRELLNNNKGFEKKYSDYLLDVNNFEMINEIFKKYQPDIVYHAAASKHVDLVERNWFHGSLNNILSTFNICKCSNLYDVKKIMFISTDKAVDPINFLGLSKCAGEKITKSFGSYNKNSNFSVVRFGNVVGSSGSLLDAIKHKLSISNSIDVTDKNMTRYFMTISDAVNLVIISTKISKNGDCHVLKMGEPVKIMDIVNSIVQQNNLYNGIEKKNIKINFTGIRPGEKLHEKLFDELKVEKTINKFILNENFKFKTSEVFIQDFLDKLKKLGNNKEQFKNTIEKFIEMDD